jgi:hypothetical protein
MTSSFSNSTVSNVCGKQIIGSNNTLTGVCNGNVLTGSNSRIHGNNNIICGSNWAVFGDDNTITGSNATVHGNRNKMTGSNNHAYGDMNTGTGSNSSCLPSDTSQFVFSGDGGRCIVERYIVERDSDKQVAIWAGRFPQKPSSPPSPPSPSSPRRVKPKPKHLRLSFTPPTSTTTTTSSSTTVMHDNNDILVMTPTGLDEDTTIEELQCVVCLTHRRKLMIPECKHSCLCHTCAHKIINGDNHRCPVCRGLMTKALIQFFL